MTTQIQTGREEAGRISLVREVLLGLALFYAVVLVYQPVWRGGFVWDDALCVTGNPAVTSAGGLATIWTTSAADVGPLTVTFFWLEHALWELAPGPYHLVTLFFHAGAAIVLWRVLLALRIPGAWLGAALWALHPVQVESAAWISELKNTASGFFFLLTILFFTKWLDVTKDKTPHGPWHELTLLCAAAALACKSSTVVLPIILALVAWWRDGRWSWRHSPVTVPILVLAAIAALWTLHLEQGQIAPLGEPAWQRTWPERFVTAGAAVWFYLAKLAWPVPVIPVYPPWMVDASQFTSWFPLLVALGLFAVLWSQRLTAWRPVFFAYACFLAALLPVLGFVDNAIFRHALVFDHFQYLASIAPLALAGAGLARLKNFRVAASAVVLLALGFTSWGRAHAYASSSAFWADVVRQDSVAWVGHCGRGYDLLQHGRAREAIGEFQRALECGGFVAPPGTSPRMLPGMSRADAALVHRDLAIAFERTGNDTAAQAELKAAQHLDPAANRASP